jgi:hemolysin III
MVLLLIKKGEKRSFHHILGCTVFGFSLLTLYTVSTVYHSSDFWFHQSWKAFYHKLDHISIFILIAGSYTPLLTIILMKHGKRETIGLMTLIFVWLFAASGTVLKIFVDIKTVPEYVRYDGQSIKLLELAPDCVTSASSFVHLDH